MKYDEYQYLLFERHPDGILLITLNRPDVLNATNNRLHWELSRVWREVDEDDETNVVVITGKGRAFSRRPRAEDAGRQSGTRRTRGTPGRRGTRRFRA